MRSLCLGLFVVIVGVGCQRAPTSADTAVEPVLVFSDDFDGSGIAADWSAEGDAWRIEDGWLAVEGARNDALWLQVALPEDVRIAFRAKSLSEEGDIKFEVFGDGATHESGYIAIFGGWSNQLNIIARLDEHGDDRLVGAPGVRVEPGRAYDMVVERTDGRVRWTVDGEPFLTFEDAEPLVGSAHEHFGFNDWDAPLRFDDVRVWDLSP